jgi:hypothetical protein
MRRKVQAQIHALDRVKYLLEEGSFKQLGQDSTVFSDIVENLYAQVNQHVQELSGPRAHY